MMNLAMIFYREIKNLNIKLVMEKIIEMATLYKFGKNYLKRKLNLLILRYNYGRHKI